MIENNGKSLVGDPVSPTSLYSTKLEVDIATQNVERKIPEKALEIVKGYTIQKINTMSELRKTVGKEEGEVVELLGYSEAGDKNPIRYIWNTSQNIDNDSSLIVNSSGTWVMIPYQKVTIIDFGIVNDHTIDQSIRLDAFAKYCDDNSIYEINFLNYRIQTSRTVHYTTSRGSRLTGIAFRKPKRLKNLHVEHDKSMTLYQGASLILWLPDYLPTSEETFEMDNIIFDPYCDKYTLISGEGDGMFGGFYAYRIGDAQSIAASVQTNYSIKINNVNFISPAISRNISTANIRFRKSEVSNCKGEYWALYTHIFATEAYYENVVAIYRKDLQDVSTRNLVLTMIHHEPETRNYEVNLDLLSIKRCKTYSIEGTPRTVCKHHTVEGSSYNIKTIIIEDIEGIVGWSVNILCYADNVYVSNIKNKNTELTLSGLQIKNLEVSDGYCPDLFGVFANKAKTFERVVIKRCTVYKNMTNLQGASTYIKYFELDDVVLDKEDLLDTNGIFRSVTSTIEKSVFRRVSNPNKRFVDAIMYEAEVDGHNQTALVHESYLLMRGDNITKTLSVNDFNSVGEASSQYSSLIGFSGTGHTVDFKRLTNFTGNKRPAVVASYENNVFPDKGVTTANLPVLDSNKLGYRIYDTTLKQYKVWNGTSWLLDSINQSAAITNVTATAPAQITAQTVTTIEEAQTSINILVSAINDLKVLSEENKTKINAKLTADRASGQQAT